MSSESMENEPTEEQLWELLPEQVGVAKVATLIDLTNATANRNDYGYALSIAETGVETAKQERDDQILAKALVTRAHVYWHLNQYEQSAEDYVQAAGLFAKYDSLVAAARGYYDASKSYYYANLHEMALDLNARAQEYADASEELEAIGRCHLQKARLQDELDYPMEEVLASLEAGRARLREGQLSRYVLDADEHRIQVLCDHDEYEKALEIASNALHVAETIHESRGAYFNFLMGVLHRQLGRPEEAFAYLDKCEAINRQIEDIPGLASVLMERARSLRAQNRFEEAIELLAKTRAHFDYSGIDEAMFSCDMLRITSIRESGRLDDALAECREYWKKVTDPLEQLVVGLQIAEIFFAMRQYRYVHAELEILKIDEAWVGKESAWFTYQRILAATYEAEGKSDFAKAVAREALRHPGIKSTYPSNRTRLRQLAGE